MYTALDQLPDLPSSEKWRQSLGLSWGLNEPPPMELWEDLCSTKEFSWATMRGETNRTKFNVCIQRGKAFSCQLSKGQRRGGGEAASHQEEKQRKSKARGYVEICMQYTWLDTLLLRLSTEWAFSDSVTSGQSDSGSWSPWPWGPLREVLGQQHSHQLAAWRTCTFLGLSPDLMNQKLWVWDSAIWVIMSPQMIGTCAKVWQPLP